MNLKDYLKNFKLEAIQQFLNSHPEHNREDLLLLVLVNMEASVKDAIKYAEQGLQDL